MDETHHIRAQGSQQVAEGHYYAENTSSNGRRNDVRSSGIDYGNGRQEHEPANQCCDKEHTLIEIGK